MPLLRKGLTLVPVLLVACPASGTKDTVVCADVLVGPSIRINSSTAVAGQTLRLESNGQYAPSPCSPSIQTNHVRFYTFDGINIFAAKLLGEDKSAPFELDWTVTRGQHGVPASGDAQIHVFAEVVYAAPPSPREATLNGQATIVTVTGP